jgi:hypothetical protein
VSIYEKGLVTILACNALFALLVAPALVAALLTSRYVRMLVEEQAGDP